MEKFKAEAFRFWNNRKRICKLRRILMFNTGLRTAEQLWLLNSDIDLEIKVLCVQREVKEILRRNGTESTSEREMKVGKVKSSTSKRTVQLNNAAVEISV